MNPAPSHRAGGTFRSPQTPPPRWCGSALAIALIAAAACGSRREARRDVETFARSVSAQSDKASVRSLAKTLRHAWIVEDSAEEWRLLTPPEFGARHWVALISFRPDRRLRGVRCNTLDALGTKYRSEDVPPDQCFDPNGCP